MTPREEGFLLLASQLGDPGRKPLTLPQLRNLSLRMRGMKKPLEDRLGEYRETHPQEEENE